MGLDMYLCKITKVPAEVIPGINGNHKRLIEQDGYTLVSADEVERDNKERYIPIMNFLTKVRYIETLFNYEKLKKDNNIPQNAYLRTLSYGLGASSFVFETEDGKQSFPVSCTTSHYEYISEAEGYVYLSDDIACWRGNQNLHQRFKDGCEQEVLNCGYSIVSGGLLDQLIHEGELNKHVIECDKDSVIVYMPWW